MAEEKQTTKKPAAKKAVAVKKAAVSKKPEDKKAVAVKKSTVSKKPDAKKAVAVKKVAVSKKPEDKKVVEVKKATVSKKPVAKKVAVKKNTVRVTLVKSFYGRLPAHRATVTGLGLKRINHTVELIDTPQARGMINKVSYLLRVEA